MCTQFTFWFQKGLPGELGFLNILCFTDVGTQCPEREERKRLLQGSCQISLKCVDRKAERGWPAARPHLRGGGQALGGWGGGRQSDQVVVGPASLLPLKTSFIISR